MQEKFDMINKEYRKRRSRLIMSGNAQRPTSSGYWSSSNPEHVFELFRKLNLEKHRSFVDLGSGDGIVVATAALFTDATGIESDPALHNDAKDMRQRLGMDYALKNMDYLEEDLSRYDVIFINPDNYFHKVEKSIVEHFKGTLIVFDNIFSPLTLNYDRKISIRGTVFSIYLVNQEKV